MKDGDGEKSEEKKKAGGVGLTGEMSRFVDTFPSPLTVLRAAC